MCSHHRSYDHEANHSHIDTKRKRGGGNRLQLSQVQLAPPTLFSLLLQMTLASPLKRHYQARHVPVYALPSETVRWLACAESSYVLWVRDVLKEEAQIGFRFQFTEKGNNHFAHLRVSALAGAQSEDVPPLPEVRRDHNLRLEGVG